jgi:AcrR family transcriptional regulator
VTERIDPRITRTTDALEQAVVELAGQQPVSRISVAALADRARVTRATFYNHYDTPLDVLIGVLTADLDRGHQREEQWRAEGAYTAAQLLRLTTAQVVDHVDRFRAVYRHSLADPADRGVYDALVRHFTDYAQEFMARTTHPDVPRTNHVVAAAFVAHGFAGAIRAWLNDDTLTSNDLVDAAVACAPTWWS